MAYIHKVYIQIYISCMEMPYKEVTARTVPNKELEF